jgi:predicted small lipoprotein YifL
LRKADPPWFSMTKSHQSSMGKTLLLALFMVTALWGCGKKGPPLPPESNVPAAVTDLQAWPRDGRVFLGWTIPTRNIDGSKLEDLLGFKVFRMARSLISAECPECPRNFKVVAEIDIDYPRTAQVEGGRVLWADPTVKPQTEYTYLVRGYNFYKSPSPESNRVAVFWAQSLPAPEEVRVQSGNQALEITWRSAPARGEAPSAAGFNLYRRTEGERFGFRPLNPELLKEPRFVDGGLQNGKKYYYEVRAVRNFHGTLIESPASAVVEGIPAKRVPPSPPRGLVAVFQEGGVLLRWEENPEPDIAGYEVYRRAEGEETFRKLNSSLIREPQFLDASADPKKSYTYRLKAVDSSPAHLESDFSQDAEVAPLPTKP